MARTGDIELENTATPDQPTGDEKTIAATGGGRGTGAERLPEVARERYEITEEVGRGGLGKVSRARDVHLDRSVAIKELHSVNLEAGRRFVREALITARLEHPGIVAVHEAGRWPDGNPFYSMKLVRGRPLADEIDGRRTLDERLGLIPTVLAVVDAVAYAHSQGVIHRDLKPHNVLVGDFGETVVIDWGLAKQLDSEDPGQPATSSLPDQATVDATILGSVIGTPAYMPPEQAAGEPVDARADVYSLGALLYHVLAGAPPHAGPDVETVLAAIRTGRHRPIVEREPTVPRDLAAIVTKAMAFESEERYPTARELAEDLRRFQLGQLVGAHHYTRGQRVRLWLRKHRAIATASAAAAVIVAVIAVISIRKIIVERDRADAAARIAVESSRVAAAERDRAVAAANHAHVAQARDSLARDPAESLAWLRQMSPAGPDWGAARVIAADALWREPAQRILRGHRGVPRGLVVVGERAVTWDDADIWIWDLAAGTGTELPAPGVVAAWACPGGKTIDARPKFGSGVDAYTIDVAAGTVVPRATGEPGGCARPEPELPPWGEAFLGVARDRSWGVRPDADQLLVYRSPDAREPVRRFPVDGHLRALRVSPDSRWLAAVGDRGGRLWEVAGVDAIPLAGHAGTITHAEFLADGHLVTASEDRTIRVWAPASRAHAIGATITAGAAANGTLWAGTDDGRIVRVDPQGTVTVVAGAGAGAGAGAVGEVRAIAVRGDDLAFSIDRTVWRIRGNARTRLGEHGDVSARPGSFSWFRVDVGIVAGGAIASWDGVSLQIWRDHGAEPVNLPERPSLLNPSTPGPFKIGSPTVLCGPSSAVVAHLAISPDGTWIVVSRREPPGCDGTPVLVDATTGTPYELPDATGQAFAFSADGARLATGSTDGAVLIWDVATRTSTRIPAAQRGHAAAFSPDGRWIAITTDGGAALVDTTTATARFLAAPEDRVIGAWFTPDSSSLIGSARATPLPGVLVGERATLHLWDTDSGEHRAIRLDDHTVTVDVRADAVRVLTAGALWIVPDDLPRAPTELAAALATR
jgi:eukaryotic-like serine/threonine-protein kinase